jgi:hypothetical protein
VLTVLPPPRVRDEEALMRVAAWFVWPGWERFILSLCSAFHFLIGGALLWAPTHQVVNAGTAPVFELAPRWVWGSICIVAGVTALFLLHRVTLLRQLVTWYCVFPLGFAWSGAFLMALIDGRGSAIGAVIFPFTYLIFGAAAMRIGLRKR